MIERQLLEASWETAVCFELQQGGAPGWIELIPPGFVAGRDGRSWNNDRPNGIVSEFATDGRDVVIDFEHATEIKAPKGEPAPAAGWITKVENRSGSIWGKVNWTPSGKASIISRAYRYISPVFLFTKAGKRIVKITSAGLTNHPNLRLAALNHQTSTLALNAQEKDILGKMGISEKAYLNIRAQETRQSALNAQEHDILGRLGISESDYLKTEA